MLIRIKMTKGGEKVGKVDVESLKDVHCCFKNGFLMLNHSTGPILINVANIDSITRAQ